MLLAEKLLMAGTDSAPIRFISYTTGLGRAISVAGNSTHIFVADDSLDAIISYAISGSGGITQLDTLSLGHNPREVVVEGNYLYVSTSGGSTSPKFFVIDASDPSDMSISHSSATSTSEGRIAVSGSKLVLTQLGAPSSVETFDITSPTSPTFQASLTDSFWDETGATKISGNTAVVAGRNSTNKLTVNKIDISNLGSPFRVGSALTTSSDFPNDIALDTSNLFVLGEDEISSFSVNYTNSSFPTLLDTLTPSSFLTLGGLDQSGDRLAVSDIATDAVRIFDVSNPNAISEVLIYEPTENTTYRGIVWSGSFLYVCTQTASTSGVTVIKVQ